MSVQLPLPLVYTQESSQKLDVLYASYLNLKFHFDLLHHYGVIGQREKNLSKVVVGAAYSEVFSGLSS